MAGAVGGFSGLVNHSNPIPGFLWGIGAVEHMRPDKAGFTGFGTF